MATRTLSPELLHKMDAYWRAANYLSVGQIYLYDNPLLKRPLTLADVKHMLLGHWGTTPGQNFIYVHLNRVIKKCDLDMICVSGPGHGVRPSRVTRISSHGHGRIRRACPPLGGDFDHPTKSTARLCLRPAASETSQEQSTRRALHGIPPTRRGEAAHPRDGALRRR